MSFPQQVRDAAFVACGRHCCICHRFCGLKIELHHIVQRADGGLDTFDNAIPLCFECHADMRSYDHMHPKGSKYSVDELRQHRDSWYQKVKGSPAPAYGSEQVKLDQETFVWLKDTLPWSPSISWVSNSSFAGYLFDRRLLDPFDKLFHESKDPSREFVDADLEAMRVDLLLVLGKFLAAIGQHTFPSRNANSSDHSGVPDEWEYEQPERFEMAVREIHDAASGLATAYSKIIREGRRRLGIS